MLKTLLPLEDELYNRLGFTKLTEDNRDDENGLIDKIVPISEYLLESLGIHVTSNRRICFGGEPLFGIFLPQDKDLFLTQEEYLLLV